MTLWLRVVLPQGRKPMASGKEPVFGTGGRPGKRAENIPNQRSFLTTGKTGYQAVMIQARILTLEQKLKNKSDNIQKNCKTFLRALKSVVIISSQSISELGNGNYR
jgi:hypothetical protein|tara:strand:+ start:194 stop:511 length:318 start_codon:yes stop_codon:yes gene_type:complete